MSGGHWNYMSARLDDRAKSAGEVWRLMAALEHELDWGISADTCYECAKRRVAAAVESFFDSYCNDATIAIAIARDHNQHMCDRCADRAVAPPTPAPIVASEPSHKFSHMQVMLSYADKPTVPIAYWRGRISSWGETSNPDGSTVLDFRIRRD